MASNVIMPKLGMNMKEGTLVEWLRREREHVNKGEPIAVISSDKIQKEIEAPEDGLLLKINTKENDVVPIGTTIAIVGRAEDKLNGTFKNNQQLNLKRHDKSTGKFVNRLTAGLNLPKDEGTKKILISPSAKKLAESMDIDIKQVQGTGPNGRITNNDIRNAARRHGAPSNSTNLVYDGNPSNVSNVEKSIIKENHADIEPLVGMRRTIADRLIGSLQNTAQLTITMKAEITELQKVRKSINEFCEKDKMDVKLTLTDFIAKAVIMALQEYPIMNSTLINNEIHYNKEIHLGIAVSLKSGLIVPVVRNAEKLSIREISYAIKSLRQRALDNQLDLGEIIGSTFSITNLGTSGVEFFTPVLNPPETGILGIGSFYHAPEFDSENRVVERDLLPLSLTFDHRVTDGKPASEFLAKVKYLLKNPLMLLL